MFICNPLYNYVILGYLKTFMILSFCFTAYLLYLVNVFIGNYTMKVLCYWSRKFFNGDKIILAMIGLKPFLELCPTFTCTYTIIIIIFICILFSLYLFIHSYFVGIKYS